MKRTILSMLICSILLVCALPLDVRATEPIVQQEDVSESPTDASTAETNSIITAQEMTEPTVSTEDDEASIDYAFISAVASAVTAVVAIVAPIISNIVNVKSNEKLKRLELHSPRVYHAVAQMIISYSNMPRHWDYTEKNLEQKERYYQEVHESFNQFRASSYEVMSLVPNIKIHQQILDCINILEANSGHHFPKNEEAFQKIVAAIAMETSPYTSTREHHIPRKCKCNHSK